MRVKGVTQTMATITIQNYFRMYEKLAGMTGTAETEETEFFTIDKLEVAVIPTNKEVIRDDWRNILRAFCLRIAETAGYAVSVTFMLSYISEEKRAGRPVTLA